MTRAVVFDMGGVLVELGPLTDILGDDPLPTEVFWSRWLASPSVRAFEMGRTSPESFAAALVDELGLSFPPTELLDRFLAWPKGLFAGSTALLGAIDERVDVAVLSNTNALHWHHQRDAEQIRGLFDRWYLSFELGLAKPDTDIFAHVIADLALDPGAVLFIDDNQPNVDGARSLGIDAVLARGPDEARAALAERGLVAD